MTTTKEKARLEDLPHWEIFSKIFDREICSPHDVSRAVYVAKKVAFFVAYQELYDEYGFSKSSYEYLEMLVKGEAPDAQVQALSEGRHLLPSEEPHKRPRKPTRSPRPPKDDSDDTPTKVHSGWRERFKEFMEPSDIDKTDDDRKVNDKKKEVAS